MIMLSALLAEYGQKFCLSEITSVNSAVNSRAKHAVARSTLTCTQMANVTTANRPHAPVVGFRRK